MSRPRPRWSTASTASASSASPMRLLLARMSFAQKIGVLPAVAAIGFLAILVATLILGRSSLTHLTRIESGYAPAIESSRQLERVLATLQRNLQDAVAAKDTATLEASGGL